MSLRDDLFGRARAVATVRLPVDRVAFDRATEALEVAERALERAPRGSFDLAAERAAVAAAEAALAAVPVRAIELQALAPPDWEALIDAHPPTETDRAKGWRWDAAEFWPAALAASVVAPAGEDPLTVDDWRKLSAGGQLTLGELNQLYEAIVTLNERAPRVSTGKG